MRSLRRARRAKARGTPSAYCIQEKLETAEQCIRYVLVLNQCSAEYVHEVARFLQPSLKWVLGVGKGKGDGDGEAKGKGKGALPLGEKQPLLRDLQRKRVRLVHRHIDTACEFVGLLPFPQAGSVH